ncbi:MAG TPA: ABC transporter ATP-binding protein [Alphaproteobacteria bacterium]|jgi:multiple sugar transport system ATP-binding protein|nr:ABC transporter ATP-binding protein [Pseudomonadales bacterium]HIO00705.1 ABC transporter ATP-binding protein [Alphaproteobacteria bacterium]|tara:strand:+ start:1347 stop:2444 length:1098 start_codon:yes stop_codon:yes gene_type:complete
MAEVILRSLVKRFGSVPAVDNVSLQIPDGEFLVLLGPSGCGKSTILRLIAGLEDATSGEIVIDGDLVNFVDPTRRNLAMVFQNYALYPHMTVYKNVAFPLETAKMSRDSVKEAVSRVADMLEITEFLQRLPEQLSGGQRQRVALARAIVRQPKVFLMDEPLSNLDAKLRLQTRIELMSLHERLGITTLYVTHDQVEAMTMGQRIAVLHEGKLQQLGTPAEVYDVPANKFVATFMGAPPMNLIDGELQNNGTEWVFTRSDYRFVIDRVQMNIGEEVLSSSKGTVSLGVRPEDMRLASSKSEGIPGVIRFLEPIGSDLFVTIDVDPHSLQVRLPPKTQVATGDKVGIEFDYPKAHIFNVDEENLQLL